MTDQKSLISKFLGELVETWKPPPKIKISEWADRFRYLSSEASAEPGKWYTSRAPYQRGIMNALNDRNTEMVVMLTSSQVGKTELINNIVGYYIDQDPSPILMVQPTLQIAEAWSKDRLVPMVRDSPVLSSLINLKRRDGENTVHYKKFPGGHITMAGANSPASLASRPIRIVLLDEVDRYPASAGAEGDPANLARARAKTFWNRKVVMASTPTVKDASRIAAAYENSDQRKYYVPCPHCSEYQLLVWSGVQWQENKPQTAIYVCQASGCIIEHGDKQLMLENGEWRAEGDAGTVAGFYLNEIYSPWVTWEEMVVNFLEAKKLPETLKTFVNTSLAEPWEDSDAGEIIDPDSVSNRAEKYPEKVPAQVIMLTAGVDIQDDRIEVEILGWGVDEETWSIDYIVINGDPGVTDTWNDLDDILTDTYAHESGIAMRIAGACVDSGGHYTDETYRYCKKREKRRFYAIKGSSVYNAPLVPKKPTRNNRHNAPLYVVGTDTAKDTIYARLKLAEPGPGCCHFPLHYDDEYFAQLTVEKVVKRYERGKRIRRYEKKQHERNEALDCRVYNLAAFRILKPNMKKVKERHDARIIKLSPAGDRKNVDNTNKSDVRTQLKQRRAKNRKGFVKSYKG